jgi:hypothetical protein
VIPYCAEMKDMGSPEMIRKYQEGPVAHVTLFAKGVPNMGKYLGQWFLWTLVIATVTAYLTARLVPAEAASAVTAAKLVFALSFLAHGFGSVPESIWFGRSWFSTAKHMFDAALYATGSAAVFWWLWA